MGHATHFLSRLQRLDSDQLDLAMALYRDPTAVRLILGRHDLAPEAERVALALGRRSDEGHVIVARDGGFVTCLGPGMRVGDRPVISREAIDDAIDASALIGRTRARLKLRGGVDALLRRVVHAGFSLAREDFEAAAVFAPLIGPALADVLDETVADVLRTQRWATVRGLRRRDKATEDRLRAYATDTHTIRHLLLMSIPLANATLQAGRPASSVTDLARNAVMSGETTSALAAAVYAAELGPDALPGYHAAWRKVEFLEGLMHPFVGLAAIGTRHPAARAEVRRIFADRAAPIFSSSIGADVAGIADEAIAGFETHERAAREAEVRAVWRQHILESTGAEVADEALTDDFVDAFAASGMTVWLGNARILAYLVRAVTWAAGRSPADMYLRADWVAAMDTRLDLEPVRASLIQIVQYEGRHEPVVRDAPKVGRNDRCPCGSGRKYKRCCLHSG